MFFDRSFELKTHPKKTAPASKSLKLALENPQDQDFVDFLTMCLEWYRIFLLRAPEKRSEALDCLKHPWILKGLPE